jgi:hypothetical protein
MSTDLDATLASLEAYAESLPHTDVAQSLSEKVQRKIDDRSYTYDDIVEKLNQGLRWISGKWDVPDLEEFADLTLDTGANNIPLPMNFQKKLLWAHSTTHNRRIKVYPSAIQLLRWFNMIDQTGRVLGVAQKGRRLFYQRIPSSAETVRINFFKFPDPIDRRTSKVDVLPYHLVDDLLVNYACKEIFEEIEDGLEGEKVNTNHYTNKWKEAVGDLIQFWGPPKRIPVEIETEIDWDAYLVC